eukprot:2600277-Alexandrium_andersonii.AAC.1
MLAKAAIRLNPQSAMCKMQTCFRRSNLELRGPRKGLDIDSPSSREVRSARFFVQIPNLPAKAGLEGVRGRESTNSQ